MWIIRCALSDTLTLLPVFKSQSPACSGTMMEVAGMKHGYEHVLCFSWVKWEFEGQVQPSFEVAAKAEVRGDCVSLILLGPGNG